MTAPLAAATEESWGATLRRLLTLAWPIVLARIGIMTMGLVDAVVVGRFSARELGFHALGWAPTSIVLTGAIGLLTGVQVFAARRVGEGRPELAGAVLRRGLVYALWVGLLSSVVLGASGASLMTALRLEPVLAAGSGRVMQAFALSLTPYLLSVVLTFWLEGLGRPGPGMRGMLWANGLNLVLNLVLVPGMFGLPALGAVGAALATLGARSLLLVYLAVHILRSPDSRALGVFAATPPEPDTARAQRRVGYGAGASYFVEAGAFAGMNVVAGWLGGLAVGAWAVVLNFTALVFMVPLGVAGATAVLVGARHGAGDRRGVVRAATAGCAIVLAASLLVSLGVAFGPAAVAGAYASDPALVALAAGALALSVPFFAPDAVQAVLAQVLRARGDVLAPTVIHIACYALLMLPLGWWLAHPGGLGVAGCVWAVIVASFASATLLVLRFAWVTSRDRPRRPPGRARSHA